VKKYYYAENVTSVGNVGVYESGRHTGGDQIHATVRGFERVDPSSRLHGTKYGKETIARW